MPDFNLSHQGKERPSLLSGRLTVSRVPMCLALSFGIAKWLDLKWLQGIAWEWVLFPWWAPACFVAFHNHCIDFGRGRQWKVCWTLAAVSAVLVFARAVRVPHLVFFEWWVLTAPIWTGAAIAAMHSWTRQYEAIELKPSGRFWLCALAIILLKWFDMVGFRQLSWFWLIVALGILLLIISLFNVLRLGGGRYFLPAAVLLAGTVVAAAIRTSLHGTRPDVDWIVLFAPATLYGVFCSSIVLPSLRRLRQRMRERNEHIQKRLEDQRDPERMNFHRTTFSLPIESPKSHLQILQGAALLLAAAAIDFVAGVIAGYCVFGVSLWIGGYFDIMNAIANGEFWRYVTIGSDGHELMIGSKWRKYLGSAAFIFLATLSLYWIFIPSFLAVRVVAERLDSGHRGTLWVVSAVGAMTALWGVSWIVKHQFGLEILLQSNLSLGGLVALAVPMFILFFTQAGCLGMTPIFQNIKLK